MKTIKYILGTLAAVLSMTACVGDLNVTPIDPNANTADKALSTEAQFKAYLASTYLGFATSGYYGANGAASISGLDGGASQYIRGLYHVSSLTTDEAVCGWNDQTIKNFHWMNWTTDDTFIYAFYSRIFMQVSAANEFIREAAKYGDNVPNRAEYIAEARVLRAIAYYHALDNFGNVPFADETAIVGAVPQQISRADLYAWLETELLDLINGSDLAAPRGNGYSRADKGVAKFLLAKLYLNAGVFTGTPQWQKCADVLKDLMDDGYSLHTTPNGSQFSAYQDLFLADNDKCTDEIIFAIQQDGVNTTSYGVTNYLIFASTGGKMNPADLGISSGWGGLRTTPEFYNKFSSGDARNLFYTTGHKKDIEDIGEFTNGYAFMKYRNIKSDGNPGQELGFVDTDFPMMRYADVLLMAAECQVRGASIDGLAAYNQVRKRAGVPEAKAIVLQDILDERGRELYQECWRRNDLVRFGQFTTSAYLWQWKGNDFNGKAVEDYRNLFPIPDSDRLANSNLVQNEGYK